MAVIGGRLLHFAAVLNSGIRYFLYQQMEKMARGPRLLRRICPYLNFLFPDYFPRGNLLFVSIPRSASVAITSALYGKHEPHLSMQFFRSYFPEGTKARKSFAVMRDPVDRFLSAYALAFHKKTGIVKVSSYWTTKYRNIHSVSDMLDFLEARADNIDYLDHHMKTQSFYVTDPDSGAVIVDRLFRLETDQAEIGALLAQFGASRPGRLNESLPVDRGLSETDRARIRALYAVDCALYESLANRADLRAPM